MMRRQSAPTNCDCKERRQTSIKLRSVSHSPSSREKSPLSLSPSHTSRARMSKSPAPPRPTSGPSRPPRPPPITPVQGCSNNKTAPYSQLYATTNQAASKDTLVIDTKSLVGTGKEKLKTIPRFYGKKCETPAGVTTPGNGGDASTAYGKRTQAALNKLVATVKLFNKSTSTSGGQKSSTQQSAKKPPVSKTPPQRPPPAVRNTPRPSIPKSVLFGEESTEDNLCINEYDDHIYMEVGMAQLAKQKRVNCYTAESRGEGGVDERGNEEDPYVIMNPGSDSHVYTSLDFGTRNESEGKSDAVVSIVLCLPL